MNTIIISKTLRFYFPIFPRSPTFDFHYANDCEHFHIKLMLDMIVWGKWALRKTEEIKSSTYRLFSCTKIVSPIFINKQTTKWPGMCRFSCNFQSHQIFICRIFSFLEFRRVLCLDGNINFIYLVECVTDSWLFSCSILLIRLKLSGYVSRDQVPCNFWLPVFSRFVSKIENFLCFTFSCAIISSVAPAMLE